jgi:S1-C subfamily serine protease
MLRVVAAGLAVALAGGGTEWEHVVEQVARSVVEVESKTGRCTGFVVHTARKGKEGDDVDYVLTAAHCFGAELYADRSPARVVHHDPKKDLVVVEVEDTGRPALTLARQDPKVGAEVASYGYGYGLDRRVTHVADTKTYIVNVGGPFVATDTTFVGGQSGGPVINIRGEVVMIVQKGTDTVGLGVGAETLRDRVGKYFELK